MRPCRARTTAEDTGTSPGEFAKSVVVWVDGSYALAVVPATHFVAESRLARSIGADEGYSEPRERTIHALRAGSPRSAAS